MFAEERKNKIEERINKLGKVTVNKLAKKYNVSKATIRRDLSDLEALGILRRTHGGAVKPLHTKSEPTFNEKSDRYFEEKKSIGQYASLFIKDGDTIALDSGTTTLQIAKNISSNNITVITNSIIIARVLSDNENINLIVIGGDLRKQTLALVGPIAENNLKNFNIDKVFLGANGITIEEGFTTPDYTEANIKKVFMERSEKVIFVSDNSKFGKKSFVKISSIKNADVLITDNIDQKLKNDYEKNDIKILVSNK
ncbi:MAG: DeoR/GlpR family DNA-binding transcription regulator [Bacillota bacterium]